MLLPAPPSPKGGQRASVSFREMFAQSEVVRPGEIKKRRLCIRYKAFHKHYCRITVQTIFFVPSVVRCVLCDLFSKRVTKNTADVKDQ